MLNTGLQSSVAGRGVKWERRIDGVRKDGDVFGLLAADQGKDVLFGGLVYLFFIVYTSIQWRRRLTANAKDDTIFIARKKWVGVLCPPSLIS
jgi:hypothetical protein